MSGTMTFVGMDVHARMRGDLETTVAWAVVGWARVDTGDLQAGVSRPRSGASETAARAQSPPANRSSPITLTIL